MQVEEMTPLTPNPDGTPINPVNQDPFLRGHTLGRNVTVMVERFDSQHQNYIVVVDTLTGKRLRICFATVAAPTADKPTGVKKHCCPNCGAVGTWPPGTVYEDFPRLCPRCKPHESAFLAAYCHHAETGE
jgi:hypothetical protein